MEALRQQYFMPLDGYPCSRPSRTSPPGGPQVGPSLTAAARDGRIIVRVGTEEWLRQGPNKRMAPNRRAKCRQTRYPEPKPSTLHETGASPHVCKEKDPGGGCLPGSRQPFASPGGLNQGRRQPIYHGK
jgi:hypothetical protein